MSKCDVGTIYGTTPELHFVRGVAAANLGQYSRALLDIGKAKRAGFKTKRCEELIKQIEAKTGDAEQPDKVDPPPSARPSNATKAPELSPKKQQDWDPAETMTPQTRAATGLDKLTVEERHVLGAWARDIARTAAAGEPVDFTEADVARMKQSPPIAFLFVAVEDLGGEEAIKKLGLSKLSAENLVRLGVFVQAVMKLASARGFKAGQSGEEDPSAKIILGQ